MLAEVSHSQGRSALNLKTEEKVSQQGEVKNKSLTTLSLEAVNACGVSPRCSKVHYGQIHDMGYLVQLLWMTGMAMHGRAIDPAYSGRWNDQESVTWSGRVPWIRWLTSAFEFQRGAEDLDAWRPST